MKWNSQLSLNISKGILGDFFLSVDGLLRGGMRISCVFILLLWGMCSFSVEAAEVQTINPGGCQTGQCQYHEDYDLYSRIGTM